MGSNPVIAEDGNGWDWTMRMKHVSGNGGDMDGGNGGDVDGGNGGDVDGGSSDDLMWTAMLV